MPRSPSWLTADPTSCPYNNGSTGIRADGCASCHRLHTSKSPTGYLLTSTDATVTDFCRSCHGATGTGASTDVDTGVQYALAGIARDTGTTIGALRGGGFVDARIGSDTAYRLVTNTGSVSSSKVPVGAAKPVTSAHLAIATGVTAKNVVWGNGALGTAGAGPTLAAEMECTACHNPHGNGNYRILNGIPNAGAAQTLAATAVNVTDATFDSARTRNYTVIQIAGTPGVESTYLLYADQVLGSYNALSGDYLHKNVPYNAVTTAPAVYSYDGPNARPNTSAATGAWNSADPLGFNVQMTNWCAQCHTRYMAASGSRSLYSGDVIFSYRHTTAKNRTCTTCHVAHGTNAVMNQDTALGTTYSANVPYPDGSTTAGDSRLLKADNRGTCLMCHDPTSGSAATAAGVSPLAQGTTPAYFP